MEGKVAGSNTTALVERITTNESLTQFNNESIREMYGLIDKVDVSLTDVEKELSVWVERELAKVYDIINDNPLGK